MEQLDLFATGAVRRHRARDTQIAAFKAVTESGLLSQRRQQVYKYIYFAGPTTVRQCIKGLGLEFRHSGRFTELETLGLIEEIGKTKCDTTGHMVTVYDITDRNYVDRSLLKKRGKTPERSLREVRAIEYLRAVLNSVYYDRNFDSELEEDIRGFIEEIDSL